MSLLWAAVLKDDQALKQAFRERWAVSCSSFADFVIMVNITTWKFVTHLGNLVVSPLFSISAASKLNIQRWQTDKLTHPTLVPLLWHTRMREAAMPLCATTSSKTADLAESANRTIETTYLFGHRGWIAARAACWPNKGTMAKHQPFFACVWPNGKMVANSLKQGPKCL